MADPVLGIALNPDLVEHQKLHTFAKTVVDAGSNISVLGRFALHRLQEIYGSNVLDLAQDAKEFDTHCRAKNEAYGELLKRREVLDRQGQALEQKREELEKALTAFERHGTPVSKSLITSTTDALERMKGVMTIVRKHQL